MWMEKETATHFSIHAWRIPWMEGPGGLQSMGVAEPDTTEATWQRCESAFHQCWVWERLQLALCLLFLTILQLCRLPPPLPRSSLQLFLPIHLIPAQVCQLLHCTTGLFKGLCTARLKMFSLLLIFFMYYLCEKYYKPPINLLQYRTI